MEKAKVYMRIEKSKYMSNFKIKKFYIEQLSKFGLDDIKSMGWTKKKEYSKRFKIASTVAKEIKGNVLDVGCGFGGLYSYLKRLKQKNFQYLGVDILSEMVQIARIKNPLARFKVADILKQDLGKFDYIFCIGSLNLAGNDHHNYFLKMVKRMIEMADKAVVLSFLSDLSHLDYLHPFHVEDPAKLKKEILKWDKKLGVKIITKSELKGEAFLFIYKR
jgi:SAM-dependent methyltransferase